MHDFKNTLNAAHPGPPRPLAAQGMQRVLKTIGALCLLLSYSLGVHAQSDYPARAIRLVVPYSAGGAFDTIARPLALALSKQLGQPVVVENKPGANSTIGVQSVARAAADGYTLLLGTSAGLALAPTLQPLGYDVAREFTPVSILGYSYQALVVQETSPIRSVRDLVDAAKKRPGALAYASIGVGSLSHLAMEALSKRMDVSMINVPYPGGAPAVTDLLGGQVPILMAALAASLPHIHAGKLRAIGFAGPTRSPLLPDVPTIAEQGYPGYQSRDWFGIVTPAATPPAVIAKLRAAIDAVAQTPAFQQDVIRANAYVYLPLAPETLSNFLVSELAESQALVDSVRDRLQL